MRVTNSLLFAFILCLTGCRDKLTPPLYFEEQAELENAYAAIYAAIDVPYSCPYPVFSEEYEPMNQAILLEISYWNDFFTNLCLMAQDDTNKDPDLLSFPRFFKIQYEVRIPEEENGAVLVVDFFLEWQGRPTTTENRAQRSLGLYSNGMVYLTCSSTSRVY